MARVLITAVGRGQVQKGHTLDNYRTANYSYEDKTYTTSYAAEAMRYIFDIDKVIFLGTAGSDWSALYGYLFVNDHCLLKAPDAEVDDELLADLEELASTGSKDKEVLPGEKKVYLHELDLDKVEKRLTGLKKALANCLDIILLRYGTNDEELQENLKQLDRLSNLLEDGDELYIDLTHSLRSLEFFELVAISYFRKIKMRNIKLRKISYAQFETAYEYQGKSLIVDLTKLSDLLDLFNSAEEYRLFGTTHGFDDRDGLDLEPNDKNLIQMLGEGISINNLGDFKKLVRRCHSLVISHKNDLSPTTYLTQSICEDIDSTFYSDIDDTMLTQMNLALWHFKKKRYLVAVTTGVEGTISWGRTLIDDNIKDVYKNRHNISAALAYMKGGNDLTKLIVSRYNQLREQRNELAHPSGSSFNVEMMKKKTKDAIVDMRKAYNEYRNATSQEKKDFMDMLKKAYEDASYYK